MPEERVHLLPYTTCRMVSQEHIKVVRRQRVRYVTEERVQQIPFTTCRMVPEEQVRMVPRTVCTMEPYSVTQRVCRYVPVQVPVYSVPAVPDACRPKFRFHEWLARLCSVAG